MRVFFLRQKAFEVGQSAVANAGLGAQQEPAVADQNVESAQAADHLMVGIDVEHGHDEVAQELPRVAVEFFDRCRRCEAFEKRQVWFENFFHERLPQLGTHDLLAFQQVQDNLLAGLSDVARLRCHPELSHFPENGFSVDKQEEELAQLGPVDVGGVADAERALD